MFGVPPVGRVPPRGVPLVRCPAFRLLRIVRLGPAKAGTPNEALSLLFQRFFPKIGFVPLANPFQLKRVFAFLVAGQILLMSGWRGLGAETQVSGTRPGPDEPSDYLVDFWGTEQGLPNNTVTGIVQTPDGYLWCGTYDGTVRFDGVRFMRIGPDSTNREVTRVQCLFVDHRGQLWIGSDGAGVWRYVDGTFTPFLDRAGPTRDVVRSIAEDHAGNLWIGTQGGLGRMTEGRIEWFTSANGFTNAAKSIWSLA